MEKQRDLYIDQVKGLAMLGVTFIHTVFYSGIEYVPDYMRSLSLLFDIPVFFMLSGMTSSGNIERTTQRLIKLYFNIILLVTLIWSVEYLVYKDKSLVLLLNLFTFSIENFALRLDVLEGSLWFIKAYIPVCLLGVMIIRFFSRKEIVLLCAVLLLGIIFLFDYIQLFNKILIFYLFIFLVGYSCKSIRLERKHLLIGLSLLIIALCLTYYKPYIFANLQGNKYPPNAYYLLFSSLSLFAVLYCRGRVKVLKENVFVWIGRNSLYVFLAQALSSQLLYNILPHLKEVIPIWYLLLFIMFLINILMALFITLIFRLFFDKLVWPTIHKTRCLISRVKLL